MCDMLRLWLARFTCNCLQLEYRFALLVLQVLAIMVQHPVMDDLRLQFGRLVAAHRKAKGWSQDELAKMAGIGLDMVSKVETGVTGARFPTITKLARAFGIRPVELFDPHIGEGTLTRPKLAAIMGRLARLSDDDLDWLDCVLDAVLKHR